MQSWGSPQIKYKEKLEEYLYSLKTDKILG